MLKKYMWAFMAAAAICFAACNNQTAPDPTENTEELSEQIAAVEEKDVTSYLTGLPVTETERDTRPLAVMFNNIKEGCPQSGTAQASMIYEVPVEGRITRLMGLFENYDDIEKIGSIRSCRDYFVYFALEYDCIYAHFGQATPYVGDFLNSDRVDNISGAVAGIEKPAPNSFYRTTDRKPPHNVYMTPDGIKKDIEKLGYRTTLREDYIPKFVFNEAGTENTTGKSATVLYPGGKENNKANGFSKVEARFEYNPEDGLYYRYQYGDKHIDELTGEQLGFTNVIFQYCHGEVRDAEDYLAFGCHGNNGYKVQVFTNGKMTEGTWSREIDSTPAVYVDAQGNPIPLNPGKTWVCIIWDEYGEDVVIE